MVLSDLFFIASVLFVLTLSVLIAVALLRRRLKTARRLILLLACFVGCYVVALVCVALILPRRLYQPAERRCFDDWCVTAIEAKVAAAGLKNFPCRQDSRSRSWLVTLQISSDAKRASQRATDARVELEDRQGSLYQACAPPLSLDGSPARNMSDELAPGESFYVFLPFQLPRTKTPAGLLVHHGDIPGVVIIGADQSLWHHPALHRLKVTLP